MSGMLDAEVGCKGSGIVLDELDMNMTRLVREILS